MKNAQTSLKVLKKWLEDEESGLHDDAMLICRERDIPLKTIERWIKSKSWRCRKVAMDACVGKNIPSEIVEIATKDDIWCVRSSALKYLESRKLQIPMEIRDSVYPRGGDYTVRFC